MMTTDRRSGPLAFAAFASSPARPNLKVVVAPVAHRERAGELAAIKRQIDAGGYHVPSRVLAHRLARSAAILA